MAICTGCGKPFNWGFCDGKWVLLEPKESHAGLDRTYVDENGELRADHRDTHPAGATVNVTRLDRKVKAEEVIEPDSPGTDPFDSEGEGHTSIMSRLRGRAA